jgi:hypothetical protein
MYLFAQKNATLLRIKPEVWEECFFAGILVRNGQIFGRKFEGRVTAKYKI